MSVVATHTSIAITDVSVAITDVSVVITDVSVFIAWTPFIKPLVMRQFPVVSVCCFVSTQGSGGRRA